MLSAPIHPFPARMAPELARQSLTSVPANGVVLDPMCGSGTVVRATVEAGRRCIGIDIDPLAVLIARVWTQPVDVERIPTEAHALVECAKALPDAHVLSVRDTETVDYVRYWFAPRQRAELRRLTTALGEWDRLFQDALSVALSRIIVSKERMASLARDTSHSRPHKVASDSDFDVYAGFLRSARQLAKRLQPDAIDAQATVRQGDARRLEGIEDGRFDLVITSPPYLNAIDYIRGHRLALVWLGHSVRSLRKIRSNAIGTERILQRRERAVDIAPFIQYNDESSLQSKHWGWIGRYAADMAAVLQEMARVTKPGGKLVLVLGNSFLRGAVIDNAGLIEALALKSGFRRGDRQTREIPARRRYLPPPGAGRTALDARMRAETVLTFTAP